MSAAPSLAPFFLTGPTAVGKSEVALLLAERWGGELISVDSMQVYRGLDIGTAKPSRSEQARIPHHGIDVADLTESFDAARFIQLAGEAVRDIQARGRRPIFCGGTGLYFKAFLEGLGEAPPSDPAVRAQIEQIPLPLLLAELQEKDPVAHERMDRNNPRRVQRAVEVLRLTGRPFSGQKAVWRTPVAADPSPVSTPASAPETVHPATPPSATPRVFALTRPASTLRRRMDQRVETMFADGLVEETRRLLEHGLAENRFALQAIGYRQVVEHLRGERGLAETIRLVQQKTWQFARRQRTWFRHQLAVTWLEWPDHEDATAIALRLEQA